MVFLSLSLSRKTAFGVEFGDDSEIAPGSGVFAMVFFVVVVEVLGSMVVDVASRFSLMMLFLF